MFFKRNESFRYTFQQPIPATFELNNTERYEAVIINISPNGMKMIISAEIMPDKSTPIRILFNLYQSSFDMVGEITWLKEPYGGRTICGIHMENSDEIKSVLVSQLKYLSKEEPENQ